MALSPQAVGCVLAQAGSSFPCISEGHLRACRQIQAGCISTMEKPWGFRTHEETETLTLAVVAVPAVPFPPYVMTSWAVINKQRMRTGGERADGTHESFPEGGESSRRRCWMSLLCSIPKTLCWQHHMITSRKWGGFGVMGVRHG